MMRFTLLLTAGLVLLPAAAFGQGTNFPQHKSLDAQKVVQTAELSPMLAPPAAPLSVAPSLTEISERSVDVAAPTVQLAQTSYGSGTPAVKETPKKEMAMTASPHADWTSILQRYVSAPDTSGLTHFDYAALTANTADRARLSAYIKALGATNVPALSENEAIAHYANLYNALTIDLIVQNYPLKSIRKAKTYNGDKVGSFAGPWKKVKISANGETLSLDDIEHKILRIKYPSPYVHYMVNCASVGCPNLLDTAWDADTFEILRKEAAAAYINSSRGVVVTSKGLKISSIYKWFKEDFGGKEGVLKHIRAYADADLTEAIDGGAKIVDYDYDWSLNQ